MVLDLKIISSTATTRNTDTQIKRLYGNRKVNVFPPPGINYNDSFFARESEQSNRRYLGFDANWENSFICIHNCNCSAHFISCKIRNLHK